MRDKRNAPTLEERFWAKVERSGPQDCWTWTGCLTNGYGQFWTHGSQRVRAHRFAYELLVGPIPEGLQIDHLCRVPACVNPAHLEPVTARINVLRSESPIAQAAAQVFCIHGHPLSGGNLYVDPKRGFRQCRTCNRRRDAEYKARLRAARTG